MFTTPGRRKQLELQLARESGAVRKLRIQKVPTSGDLNRLEPVLELDRDQATSLIDMLRALDPIPKQRPFICTTEQMWKLHDALPERLRAAVLLGPFAGLRDAEVCGLRISDIDFMRGIVQPAAKHPAQPLKTDASRGRCRSRRASRLRCRLTSRSGRLTGSCSSTSGATSSRHGRCNARFERHARRCPACRRTSGSTTCATTSPACLTASRADVKVVPDRLRHASATTTLDTDAHLWPDSDESTRSAIDAMLTARAESLRAAAAGSD